MIEFAVTVQGQKITCTKIRGELVSGLVGVNVHFTWSGEWQQLRRVAVFRAGGISRNVMDLENQCVIPWEVLVEPGQALMVGIQGTNEEGTAVTPTLEAEMGEILQGANPSDDPTADQPLPMWKWLKNLVEKTVEKIDQLLHGGKEEIDRVAADGRAEIDAIAAQLNGMIQDGNVIVQPAQDGEARTAIQNHTNDKNNPHGVKPAQIGAMAISGGTFTGPVMVNGLRLTREKDYGLEVPENLDEGQVFLMEDPADDYILEQGVTEGGWYYRKWNSGIVVCWKTAEQTIRVADWNVGEISSLFVGRWK